MRGAELTLKRVKESQKAAPVQSFRLSDFVSKEEIAELHERNAKAVAKAKLFNNVDSYVAKIIAFFGYDAYKDWKMGILPDYRMRRLVEAYRASQLEILIGLEAVMALAGAAGATSKQSKAAIDAAAKIIKQNESIIKGEQK